MMDTSNISLIKAIALRSSIPLLEGEAKMKAEKAFKILTDSCDPVLIEKAFDNYDIKLEDARLDPLRGLIQTQKKKSFTDPSTVDDAEALGVLLSQFSKWDGFFLCDVLFYALEDSNFHTLNKRIKEVVDGYRTDMEETDG